MTKNWMRFGRSVACLSLAALLGACAASVKKDPGADKVAVPAASAKRMVLQMTGPVEVVQSKDWEPFKGEWRSALGGAASSAGMSFESVEAAGVAAAADHAGTLVKVDVKDYRYVTPGARFGLGVMTGNAFVDANVSFIDVQTGRVFGQQRYNTSSSAWEGVFSAMTDKQVQAIAGEIVQEIAPR